MKIAFVSSNKYKIQEVQSILSTVGVEVNPISFKIEELQTEDIKKIVRDKVLQAFKYIGKPVFVEHTGLYIKGLNGFPGGLTQIFWDNLKAEKFSKIIGNLEDTSLTAKTVIGYCDSRKIHFFNGSIDGYVPKEPRGNQNFQWDCVFVPEGHCKTFAEMGDEKNDLSMRKKAFDEFKTFLKKGGDNGTVNRSV